MHKRISVIIPVYNDRDGLSRCLDALSNCDYDNYEVIVADDCSTDNSAQVAAAHKCKVAKTPHRLGPAAARQEGLKYATGQIVAFLDSDCRVTPDWLRKIDIYMTKDIGGLGGVYLYEENGTYFSLFLRYFSQYWFGRWPQKETDFLLGGNSAYWVDVLRAERPCGELIYFKGIASGDDTLMNLEISKKHRLLFIPQLQVAHSHFGFIEFLKKQFKWGFSRTAVSILYMREKLWRTKDLPVAQIIAQLFATAAFFVSLFTFRAYLILPVLVFLLLVHLNHLIYLYQKTASILFISYAFFVLISRNVAYILGATKGITFLLDQKIKSFFETMRIAMNFLNPYVPSKLHFFVTSRCNAGCDYCFLNPRHDAEADLSIEEIEKVVAKLGVLPYVVITGGEPFLRDDIAQICELFYERCLSRFFVISTNGFFTERIITQAREILRNYPRAHITIQLAIDSIESSHDRIKRLGGSFRKAVETLSELQKLKSCFQNLSVNISTVVTEENRKDLDRIANYIRENYTVDNHFISLKRCPPRTLDLEDITKEDYLSILDTVSQQLKRNSRTLFSRLYSSLYEAVISEMKRLLEKREYLRPCLAARKFLVIDEEAQLLLCELRREIIGNLIYAKSLKGLLRGIKARRLRERLGQERCFCNWGCAVTANLIFSPYFYPKMTRYFIKELFLRKTRE